MSKICNTCQNEIQDNEKFCKICGTPNEVTTQPTAPVVYTAPATNYNAVPDQNTYYYTAPANNQPQNPPAEVSVSSFFGLTLLFSIPLVGFIATIITAFAPKNKTLKNFARSYLIWYAIAIVFALLFSVIISALIEEVAGADFMEEVLEEVMYVVEDMI